MKSKDYYISHHHIKIHAYIHVSCNITYHVSVLQKLIYTVVLILAIVSLLAQFPLFWVFLPLDEHCHEKHSYIHVQL